MNNWISVTERLPDKSEHDWVLVAIVLVPEERRGVPHIAELRNGVWYAQDSDGEPMEHHLGLRVTHWMPITPENPEIETPAADVAPVVRCKDCDRRNKSADLANTVLCKWLHNITMNKTDFCSYGIIAKCSAQWESKNYQDEQDGQPFNMEFHVCTNCGKKVFFNFEKTDECPQCHARMDGGENHDQR